MDCKKRVGIALAILCICFPLIYFITVIDIIVVTDVVTTECVVTTSGNRCVYTPIYPNFTGTALLEDCPDKSDGLDYPPVDCYIHNKNLIELNKFVAQLYQSDMQNNLLLSSAILIILAFALIVTAITAVCFCTRRRYRSYAKTDTESYIDTEQDQFPDDGYTIDPELLEEIPLEREEV